MKSLSEQLSSYSAYHRDGRNKLTHFFGVPIVVYSLFIPLGWFRFAPADIPLTGATLFVVGVFIYYWRLDRMLALLTMPTTLALLYLADKASLLPFAQSVAVFAGSFIGGWIIQFLGHYFEGKRPALVDNLAQIFNAPLFLTAELLILLGFRKDLKGSLY
jgi:uncharacterized membrane protein YGL010W